MLENVFPRISPEERVTLRTLISVMVENCRTYLAAPKFVDDFGTDHTARRQWRWTMTRRYGESFSLSESLNRVKSNNITVLLANLRGFVEIFDRYTINSTEVQAIRDLCNRFPDLTNYHNLSNEDKLKVVEQVEEIARSFLQLAE